jgi:hypothetical protein
MLVNTTCCSVEHIPNASAHTPKPILNYHGYICAHKMLEANKCSDDHYQIKNSETVVSLYVSGTE